MGGVGAEYWAIGGLAVSRSGTSAAEYSTHQPAVSAIPLDVVARRPVSVIGEVSRALLGHADARLALNVDRRVQPEDYGRADVRAI
jgi:hypothetical protein